MSAPLRWPSGRVPAGICFLSHAYADKDNLEQLKVLLPNDVEPMIFPQEEADPRRAVSNGIVTCIRRADSLIFLAGGASESSIWVNFERDYALRARVPVFRFESDVRRLNPYQGTPVDLEPEFLVSKESYERANSLIDWLIEARSFTFERRPTVLRMKEIPEQVIYLLDRGRPVVWLVDDYFEGVIGMAQTMDDEVLAQFGNADEADFAGWQDWLESNSIYVRIGGQLLAPEIGIERRLLSYEMDPSRRAFELGYGIDLTSGVEAESVNWNRADDLVVRLTLLAQRTQPFHIVDESDDNLV